jgi:phage shock protein E
MTPFQWAILAGIVLLVVFTLLKRRGDIAVADAHKLVKEGALLLDVRTVAEFASGHLESAVNVPLHELDSRLQGLGPKDRAVVVYCLSGTRSGMAVRMLRKAGFSRVANLGAMTRW